VNWWSEACRRRGFAGRLAAPETSAVASRDLRPAIPVRPTNLCPSATLRKKGAPDMFDPQRTLRQALWIGGGQWAGRLRRARRR